MAARRGWRPGEPPRHDESDALDHPGDPVAVARAICLRLLAHRARTRTELADALADRDVPTAAADSVLDRFTELGLIDDVAYARAFTQAQLRDRSAARRSIAHGLRARGVPEDVVAYAVAAVEDDEEYAAAARLAQRRMRSLAGLPAPVQARRLLAVLARRGHSGETARRVVRAVVSGESGADGADSDWPTGT